MMHPVSKTINILLSIPFVICLVYFTFNAIHFSLMHSLTDAVHAILNDMSAFILYSILCSTSQKLGSKREFRKTMNHSVRLYNNKVVLFKDLLDTDQSKDNSFVFNVTHVSDDDVTIKNNNYDELNDNTDTTRFINKVRDNTRNNTTNTSDDTILMTTATTAMVALSAAQNDISHTTDAGSGFTDAGSSGIDGTTDSGASSDGGGGAF